MPVSFFEVKFRTRKVQRVKATRTEDTGDETNSSDDENTRDTTKRILPIGRDLSDDEARRIVSHTGNDLSYAKDDALPIMPRMMNETITNPTIIESQQLLKREVLSTAAAQTVDDSEYQLLLAQECFDNAMTLWGEAEYDLAMPLFLRSLEIREDILGKLHDDTAKSYLWVGSIHWHKVEHERALDNFSRCFRIRLYLYENKSRCGIVCTWIDKVLEAAGEDAPVYWQNLLSSVEHERKGDRCQKHRQFDNAIVEYQCALRFEFHRVGARTSTRNPSLLDIADLHNKIASAMVGLGNYERAMMEYRHAHRTYLDTFGLHQVSTKKNLQKIYEVGEILGFRTEVINSYTGALYDAIYLEKSADFHFEKKEFSIALQKYDRVLRCEDQGMGHLQGYYGVICNKLAECHRRVGHTDEAMRFACTAFGIFSRVLGSDHQETRAIMRMIRKIAGRPRPSSSINYQLEIGEV
jgi:tetratricopeptide (TPR) repeat protein